MSLGQYLTLERRAGKENRNLVHGLRGVSENGKRPAVATIPFTPSPHKSLTPSSERKVQRLEERVRRLESKLRKADRREAASSARLVDLAAENQHMRQELQDALEEAEEASERVKGLQQERDQYHAWWINEVKFSQLLFDGPRQSVLDYSESSLLDVPIARSLRRQLNPY
ncbi:hypothetical protein BKA70DRAFT_1421838 [Coprinopsis sp. MPI-PUGE-AT-0042]|nr:hypothetical protein BKA70DRAFT_1421838 [Coprinopsis sp. MPI-PUGE-AT-0042]